MVGKWKKVGNLGEEWEAGEGFGKGKKKKESRGWRWLRFGREHAKMGISGKRGRVRDRIKWNTLRPGKTGALTTINKNK